MKINELLELEAGLESLEDEIHRFNVTNGIIGYAEDFSNTLYGLERIQTFIESQCKLDCDTVKVIQKSLEIASNNWIEVPNILPSNLIGLESFTDEQAVLSKEYSLEKLGEIIQHGWEVLKKIIAALIKSIKDFYAFIASDNKKLKLKLLKIELIAKQISEYKQPFRTVKGLSNSHALNVIVNGNKADLNGTISELSHTGKHTAVYEKMARMVMDKVKKIEAISEDELKEIKDDVKYFEIKWLDRVIPAELFQELGFKKEEYFRDGPFGGRGYMKLHYPFAPARFMRVELNDGIAHAAPENHYEYHPSDEIYFKPLNSSEVKTFTSTAMSLLNSQERNNPLTELNKALDQLDGAITSFNKKVDGDTIFARSLIDANFKFLRSAISIYKCEREAYIATIKTLLYISAVSFKNDSAQD